MVDDVSNDKAAPEIPAASLEPDAHGQAAMLLVESLIHGLIARSVISVAEAVEIVEIAAEANVEIAGEIGDTAAIKTRSLTLLESISASLKHDVPTE